METKSFVWFRDRLEVHRAAFTDTAYPLSNQQNKRLEQGCRLLKEDKKSQASRSTQRLGRRRRAQHLLADIFESLGSDLYLLSNLAASISDLARIDQLGLIPRIGDWWASVDHPHGLSIAAAESCKTLSVQDLIRGIRRREMDLDEVSEPASRSLPAPSMETAAKSIIQNDYEEHGLNNPTLEAACKYLFFSFMSRTMVDSVPDPFRAGMQSSNLWLKESEEGGLAITNCLSLYLPERANEDVVVLVRMGYKQGWKLSNLLGLGDPGPLMQEGGDSG